MNDSRSRGTESGRNEAERKRKLAKVFGDVLPGETSDDRADTWREGEGGSDAVDDAWLKSQVPPHHG